MCYKVNLEICCEDEPSNAFPNTLEVIKFVVVCHATRVAHKLQEFVSGGPIPTPSATECPNYDSGYIRFERIFFTKCSDCIVSKGPQKYGLNEQDIPIIKHHQKLLREQLADAVKTKPYGEVVWRLSEEFNIHQRWVLRGSRWGEAYMVHEGDPLGPNPTYDLEGVRWWVEQRIGGIHPDTLEWLEKLPPSVFSPDKPKSIVGENPPPEDSDPSSDTDPWSDNGTDEEGVPRPASSVQSDSSMEGYDWYDNWAEHHAYLPAQCTLEELRALQANHQLGNSYAQP
ncbi:hypothetical protein F4774DRAFT_407733 [Daldinia eschscholtzii]|nr:hypothetical protein F4774DRAFT_407733 [Daldinia eschscholtzii]